MTTLYELSVEPRQQHGKRGSRRLRRLEKKIPGVLYGAGKETVAIKLSHNDLMKALENESFYSHILTLKLNNAEEKVVLKALQRHPYKPAALVHVDFLRINPREKLTMNIPLHFVGDEAAPGLKEGGQIFHLLNDLEIRCLPSDLPEFIEVDISQMVMNQTIHLSELVLPEGVEVPALLHNQDSAVVSLHMPHVVAEPEAAAPTEEAAAPAEGETAAKPEAPESGKAGKE